MASIISDIPRIVPQGDSLISAAKANELIDMINALKNMLVNPIQNGITISGTKGQIIFDWTQLDSRITMLESLVTGSATNGASTNANASLSGRVSNLEFRANNITGNGSGTCNGNGITLTLNISS